MSFCTKGYAETHIQRSFLDIIIGIGEILGMKIQTISTTLMLLLYTEFKNK
jgi:hypothetical protein